MTERQLLNLIEAGWGVIALYAWAWFLFMGVFTPVWMLLLLRRLGAIGRELRTMNGNPVAAQMRGHAAAQRFESDAGAQLLGH